MVGLGGFPTGLRIVLSAGRRLSAGAAFRKGRRLRWLAGARSSPGTRRRRARCECDPAFKTARRVGRTPPSSPRSGGRRRSASGRGEIMLTIASRPASASLPRPKLRSRLKLSFRIPEAFFSTFHLARASCQILDGIAADFEIGGERAAVSPPAGRRGDGDLEPVDLQGVLAVPDRHAAHPPVEAMDPFPALAFDGAQRVDLNSLNILVQRGVRFRAGIGFRRRFPA